MTMRFSDMLALGGRILLSGIFLHEAWFKMANYASVIRYTQNAGLPAQSLPLAILVEGLGGVLVLIGLFTRCASLALASFCILTALVFHAKLGDINQLHHFEKNLAIAGGFLVLAACGAGAWSVDAWRKHRSA